MKKRNATQQPTPDYPGSYYGKPVYFGLHNDMHANKDDKHIGEQSSVKQLLECFRLMGPELVQTDTKGHEGITSWPSKLKTATVSKGIKRDPLPDWRAAATKFGVPLHGHHSGIWDQAAGRKYPDWATVNIDNNSFWRNNAGQMMCPRGPYADKLLIPQLIEMIDRYGFDGFWIDGEIWAVDPCYCPRCRQAFTEQTGIAEPPSQTSDPNWPAWLNFTRESFEAYITHYCEAIRAHAPHVKLCSNWLHTFNHPGEPKVPTDWLSGDNFPMFGLDNTRCETRFMASRGRTWELTLWNFYQAQGEAKSPWVAKPPQMLMQESAVTLALGGNINIYEQPKSVRDGRMVPWRMKRLGEVGRFVKARKVLCRGTETLPQAVVLHSEVHHRAQPFGNLFWQINLDNVRGGVLSLLENSLGVDIMDEWALLPQLDAFPLVVAPEQGQMSDTMVAALKDYVAQGGRLLLSGADAFERFGAEFLGAKSLGTEGEATYHIAVDDGSTPIVSASWRKLKPTTGKALGLLGQTLFADADLTAWPSAVLNRVGKGRVVYVPCDLFRFFQVNRYPMVRHVVRDLVDALRPDFGLRAQAPAGVDVILRRKGERSLVHFINRVSGLPSTTRNGDVDEVPFVGPMSVEVELAAEPKQVKLAYEKGPLEWSFTPRGKSGGGVLRATLATLHIHATLVIE